MQKNAESVRLKSQNSQFILYVNCNSFDDAVQSIDTKFSNKKELKKITVNRIEAPTLTSEDIEKIIEYLQEKLGIKYKEKKEEKRINEEPQESMQEIKTVKPEKLTDVYSVSSQITEESEYKTKIIKNNLRSGASIYL